MHVSWWDGEKYAEKRVVVDGELIDAHALEYGADSDDVAKRYHAQVIDATLGRGECQECHATEQNYNRCKYSVNRGWRDSQCRNIAPSYIDFLCSECHFVHYHSDENDSGDGNDWEFCPKCGRSVKR